MNIAVDEFEYTIIITILYLYKHIYIFKYYFTLLFCIIYYYYYFMCYYYLFSTNFQ